VLEREDDARARGARVLAIVEGVGFAASGRRDLAPVPREALIAAVSRAPSKEKHDLVIGHPWGDARFLDTRRGLGDTLAAGPAIDVVLATAVSERRVLVLGAGLSATVGACVLGRGDA